MLAGSRRSSRGEKVGKELRTSTLSGDSGAPTSQPKTGLAGQNRRASYIMIAMRKMPGIARAVYMPLYIQLAQACKDIARGAAMRGTNVVR